MSYFHSYGGWRLHETETVEQAAAAVATHMVELFGKRARVVEVECYFPNTDRYTYHVGYTFADRIPPHRKECRDVDARITVIHHLEIKQLGD